MSWHKHVRRNTSEYKNELTNLVKSTHHKPVNPKDPILGPNQKPMSTSRSYEEKAKRYLEAKAKKKQFGATLHSHDYHPSKLVDENYDEFGYPVNQKLKKALVEENFEENFEELEKSKKDIMPMFGASPEQHHHDFANWASKSLPNKDWQIWAARNYKKNPEGFTPEVKQTLEHFGGSTHMPEVAKVRFDKTHDLQTGVNMFQDAENSYNKRIGSSVNVVKPDPGTKKVMDVGGGMAWYSLGRGACSAEGKAMGHCGNLPSEKPGDKVLSLRTEHKNSKGEVFHEPHATFIVNNGYLGEMKGRANTKPDPKYHKAIADLLLHPKINGMVGGGYLHHQNFNIDDLKPEEKQRVLTKKPNISVYHGDEAPQDLPEKFKDEVQTVLNFKKESKKKYGNDWREGMLHDISTGNAPRMALNAIKDPTDDELHKVITGPQTSQESRVQAAMIGKDSARLHSALADQDPESIAYLNKPNINAIINSGNNRAISTLASNQSLTAKDVDRIITHPNFDSLPKEASLNLLSDQDDEKIDPKHHAKFVNSKNPEIRMSMARRSDLTPDLQAKLADDTRREVRTTLATNKHIKSPEVQQKLFDKRHLADLAENPSIHPDIANRLAHEAALDPHSMELRTNLLQNESTPPEAIRTISNVRGGLHQPHQTDIYRNPNTPKDVFDKLFDEHIGDRDIYDNFHHEILNSPHLSEDQYKKIKSKFGRSKKFSEDYKNHPYYKAKPSEIEPSASKRMLVNHMNRLKEQDPKKHVEAQDKLIDQALGNGGLGPVTQLIDSGVLDNEHHAKLHDELADIASGDHKYSDFHDWSDSKYEAMLHNTLEDRNLPKEYHDEAFKRLEQNNHPWEIADEHFDRNRDDHSDEIYERTDDLARENYPLDEYLADIGRGSRSYTRGLDAHMENTDSIKGMDDHLQEKAMQSLADKGQVDEEGNYSDSDYENAMDEVKDEVHDNLKDYLLTGDKSKFPSHMHDALDSHQSDIYEQYDEAVRDGGVWDRAYEDAASERKEKLSSDPTMWPEHLQNTDWVKNNIVPESTGPKGPGGGDHGGFDEQQDDEKLAASEKQDGDLQKAGLMQKMSRPRITFPRLKGVGTRPDQDVRLLETGKQKKLYGKVAANAAVREHLKAKPKSLRDPQAATDKEAKRVEGRFDRRTLGLNYPAGGQSYSAALAGKLRSKFEEGDEQDQAKMAEHGQKVKATRDKYLQDYEDWKKKLESVPSGTNAYWEQIANRPKYVKPRKPSKRLKDTTSLSPEKQASRGRSVDSTIEHEGLHNTLNQIHHKYGPEAYENTVNKLLSNHDPETIKHIANWISEAGGYKPTSKAFKEEILAHTRDIITNPTKRERFKEYMQGKLGADSDQAIAQHIKNLKQGHEKSYKMAQDLKLEDIAGQQAPEQTKLAASEQARIQQTNPSWKFPQKPKKAPKAKFMSVEGENPRTPEETNQATASLNKGAARRLHGKIDPLKMPAREKVKEWQTSTGFLQDLDSGYDEEQHRGVREGLPEMEGGVKHRALNKLSSETLSRRHPETGERQFLLFRGIGSDEDHTVRPKHIHSTENSSWTPHLGVARGFESDRTDDHNKGRTVAAWVNESDIHSAPHMYGNIPDLKMDMDNAAQFYVPKQRLKGPNEFKMEHEIILKPHKSMRATKEDVKRYQTLQSPTRTKISMSSPKKDLNARINYRGEQERTMGPSTKEYPIIRMTKPIPQAALQAAGVGMKKPKKMAASELAKAPMPNDIEPDDENWQFAHSLGHFKTLGGKNPHVTAKRPDGTFYHRVFGKANTAHIISNDEKGEDPIAHMIVDHKSFGPQISESVVDKNYRGKGYGKALYLNALKHHKTLESDDIVSPEANKLYTKLARHPNVSANLDTFPGEATHKLKFRPTPKKMAASEMEKGAIRRLYGKFDPAKELGEEGIKRTSAWIGGSGSRERVPAMSAGGKARSLNKLMNRAKWRKNPQSGEREYLLHRQMGQFEYPKTTSKGKITHNKESSWTPDFARVQQGIYQPTDLATLHDYNHIVSAWIPESKIKTYIPQYGASAEGPEQLRGSAPSGGEQEVIVSPHSSKIEAVHHDDRLKLFGVTPEDDSWQGGKSTGLKNWKWKRIK